MQLLHLVVTMLILLGVMVMRRKVIVLTTTICVAVAIDATQSQTEHKPHPKPLQAKPTVRWPPSQVMSQGTKAILFEVSMRLSSRN